MYLGFSVALLSLLNQGHTQDSVRGYLFTSYLRSPEPFSHPRRPLPTAHFSWISDMIQILYLLRPCSSTGYPSAWCVGRVTQVIIQISKRKHSIIITSKFFDLF